MKKIVLSLLSLVVLSFSFAAPIHADKVKPQQNVRERSVSSHTNHHCNFIVETEYK